MTPIITASVASALVLAVMLFAINFVMSRTSRNRQVERLNRNISLSLDEQGGGDISTIDFSRNENKSGFAIFLQGILDVFGIRTNEYLESLNLRFIRAGIYSPNALIYYVFAKRLGWIISALVALALWFSGVDGPMFTLIVLLSILIVGAGIFGADLFIANKKAKRQQVLQRSFPDGLDLVLVCVESGLALDAALSRVCKELEKAHPELTKEFNKTRMELTLLNDRQKALANLAERTDLVPFRSLVAALQQSEKFGTSLTETLRVLSDDYRQTRMMIAENKAGRLPALMTIPMMLMMMPAFIMIIMAPAIIQFLEVWTR